MNQSGIREVRKLLAKDHKAIEVLFDKYERADKRAELEQLTESIAMALHSHLQLEEDLLYPTIKTMPKGDKLVDDILKDHQSIQTTIDELRRLFADLDGEQYSHKMNELKEHVAHHIFLSEQELIPKMERSEADYGELANQMKDKHYLGRSEKTESQAPGCLPRNRFQPEPGSGSNM